MSRTREKYEFTDREAYITGELGKELLQKPIENGRTRWDYIKEVEGIEKEFEDLAADDHAVHLLCFYNGRYPELNSQDADYSARELYKKLVDIHGFDESMGEDPFDEQRMIAQLPGGETVEASTEQQIEEAMEEMTMFDEYDLQAETVVEGHYNEVFGKTVFPDAEIEDEWGWIAVDTELADR